MVPTTEAAPRGTRGRGAGRHRVRQIRTWSLPELALWYLEALRPSPAHLAPTLRVTVACSIAVLLTQWLHAPEPSWAVISVLIMSQADAGASVARGIERLLGTMIAATFTIALLVSFPAEPWMIFFFGLMALTFAHYISQTSTRPYVGLLAGLTVAILLVDEQGSLSTRIDLSLWRFAMVALGILIGTSVELLLVPADPEALLLEDVARRLRLAAEFLRSAAEGRVKHHAPGLIESSGVGRQVELLRNAEARWTGLRLRHLEQLALVTETDRVVTAALMIVHAHARAAAGVADSAGPVLLEARLRGRLADVARRTEALASDLEARRLPGLAVRLSEPVETVETLADPPTNAAIKLGPVRVATLGALLDLERILQALPANLGFLAEPVRSRVARSPLDSPAAQPFFFPLFFHPTARVLERSLKVTVAGLLAWLLIYGLHWPEILTALVTVMVLAQGSTGEVVEKAVLRLGGAALGGVLGAITLLVFVPNLSSIAGLLVVQAPVWALAGWILGSGPRLFYAGFQVGMAYAVVTLTSNGPVLSLSSGLDRVIGILIGCFLFLVVDLLLWRRSTLEEMRQHLAAVIRAMAGVARVGHGSRGAMGVEMDGQALLAPAGANRRQLYQEISTLMTLDVASRFEWRLDQLGKAADERGWVTDLLSRLQRPILALDALTRHRVDLDLRMVIAPAGPVLMQLGTEIFKGLDRLAAGVSTGVLGPASTPAEMDAVVDGAGLRAALEQACSALTGFVDPLRGIGDTKVRAQVEVRQGLYVEVVDALQAICHGGSGMDEAMR